MIKKWFICLILILIPLAIFRVSPLFTYPQAVPSDPRERKFDLSNEVIKKIDLQKAGILSVTPSSGNEINLTVKVRDENAFSSPQYFLEEGTLILGSLGDQPSARAVYSLVIPPEMISEITSSGSTRIHIGKIEAPNFLIKTSGASNFLLSEIKCDSFACEVSGTSKIKCDNAITSTFSINLVGSSNASFSQIECQSLVCQAIGCGEIEIQGKAQEQELKLLGGDFKYQGQAFETEITKLKSSGTSSINIHASEEVSGSISGSTRVVCWGSPREKNVESISGDAGIFYR